jgi:hypothetical protein
MLYYTSIYQPNETQAATLKGLVMRNRTSVGVGFPRSKGRGSFPYSPLPRRYGDPPSPCRDSVWQPDGAAAFVAVYREKEKGVGGGMFDRRVENQKIRPELDDRVGLAANLDVHFHFGGMAGVSV